MKSLLIKSEFQEYADVDELESDDKLLIQKAFEARESSYSPYSNFKVGAAVLLENGEIILGNNQENAAYPSGMCAERVAIWAASSVYPGVKIEKIAISGGSTENISKEPVSPCGACRQSINEYEVKQKKDIEIMFTGVEGTVIKTSSIKSLLPFNFDGSLL
jgi:cytidine deaminase